MRIFLQDRQRIVEMPMEVWICSCNEEFLINGTSYIAPTLGSYKTQERAQEVLRQMFEYYRNGKNSFVMPEQ